MDKHKKINLTKISNIYITKKFSVNIWVLPVFVCAVIGEYYNMFFIAYLTALLHELAHIWAARLCHVDISEVRLYPFGITARLSNAYIPHSGKEFIIAFAGPFFNIILFWICFFSKLQTNNHNISYCADINLAMCTINLIPVLPLDGGRILKSILASKYGIMRSYNFIMKISKIAIIFLLFLAILLIFISVFNFSLILIIAFLMQNLCIEQNSLSIIALKELLNNHNKLAGTDKDYPVKTLCVTAEMPARRIFRHLTYDRYHIIHIVNSNSEIIGTVTETQVLDALTKKGIRVLYKNV